MKKALLLFSFLITLFGCTEENYYTTADGLGKVNVYIEGNITNEEAQVKLETEIGSLTENIYIRNTTQLTNIAISAVSNMQNISIKNTANLTNATINAAGSLYDVEIIGNTSLSSLEINGFNNSIANSIAIGSNSVLTNATINEIKTINNFNLSYNGVAITLKCYDLEEIKNNLYLFLRDDVNNDVSFYDLKYMSLYSDSQNFWRGKYAVLNFPELEKMNNLLLWDSWNGGLIINELYFPKLKEINSIYCSYGLGISTFNLPLLEKCNSFSIFAQNNVNPNLNMPLIKYCNSFSIGQTGMDVNKMNNYLNMFLNILPASGKTIDFSEEWISPSGQGLIDKQTLIMQGNEVLTN